VSFELKIRQHVTLVPLVVVVRTLPLSGGKSSTSQYQLLFGFWVEPDVSKEYSHRTALPLELGGSLGKDITGSRTRQVNVRHTLFQRSQGNPDRPPFSASFQTPNLPGGCRFWTKFMVWSCNDQMNQPSCAPTRLLRIE
jgi:hypothetical protein